MFDRLELSPSLAKYLISISPILGVSGTIGNSEYYMITKYMPLRDNMLLLELKSKKAPEELSLNLLRKGEDGLLISVKLNSSVSDNLFIKGTVLSVPIYKNSVLSLECKLVNQLDIDTPLCLAVYEVVQASGVAGLDPDFNDEVTIAKSIEVMTLAAVDTYIINRKIES